MIEEFLIGLPKGFAQAMMMNGTIITLAYLLVWKLFRIRLARARIPAKERVDAKQIKSEMRNALLSLAVGATFGSVMMVLNLHGYTAIYTDIEGHSVVGIVASFFCLMLLDDAWFYTVHRLLHHPRIYRYVHAVHHRSVDVNPFSSLSFHGVEAVLSTLWIVPVAMFVPIYAPVLGVMQLVGLVDNVRAHLGYELYPSWWNRSPLAFMASSTHHNMHHGRLTANYGNHFRIWDKLLGTEFADYEATFDEVQRRKQAPLAATSVA
jgi:Delta7-sterol 5-desaturase